jgi:ABC-type transporter Mla MlaB component
VLRITIQKTTDVVLLKLEGSVKGPWVEELGKAWRTSANMAGDRELVNVDLGAVSFVDGRGRDLLLRMQREGVVLKGASSFLRQVLENGNGTAEQPKG